MNADQAFDNLMAKKALPIPVARTAVDETVRPALPKLTPAPLSQSGTLKVSELFDDAPVDYLPRGGNAPADSQRGSYYNHPTETDLDAVDADGVIADDFAAARLQGARILGRDIDDLPEEEDRETPPAPGAGDPRLVGARRLRRFAYLPLADMEAFEAQVREMGVTLSALNPERPSLVVTGAGRREGRTELAIRIALALAKRVDYRVLLVDFDVRNPQTAIRLGVTSNHFTLGDVLRGSCELADALTASDEDNLYVLPSRSSDRDGDEILDVRQVETLFGEFHRTFDFTVIDCGPAGRAETMILSRLAGAAVLAGYCGRSSVSAMREAGDRLIAGGAHLAGVVLAGA